MEIECAADISSSRPITNGSPVESDYRYINIKYNYPAPLYPTVKLD